MKQLIIDLVRRFTAFAWRHEIEVEAGLTRIVKLNAEKGALELTIESDPAMQQWIALCFANLVHKSKNYTELHFEVSPHFKGDYQWITVLVKKGSGKTPHQLREEAEKDATEAVKQAAELLDMVESLCAQSCCSQKVDRDYRGQVAGTIVTDSGGLSAYAEALQLLAKYNKFRIVDSHGRMVVGYWPHNDPENKEKQ